MQSTDDICCVVKINIEIIVHNLVTAYIAYKVGFSERLISAHTILLWNIMY